MESGRKIFVWKYEGLVRIFFFFTLVFFILIGSGQAEQASSTLYTDPTSGISLQMPPGWVSVNPSEVVDARDDTVAQVFFLPPDMNFDTAYQMILYAGYDVWGMFDDTTRTSLENMGIFRENYDSSLFSIEDIAIAQNISSSIIQTKNLGGRDYFVYSISEQATFYGVPMNCITHIALCYDNGYLHTFSAVDLLNTEEVLGYYWDVIASLTMPPSILIYSDSTSGVTFSVGEGWKQVPLDEERMIVKAKFSNDQGTITFTYGYADARSIYDSSWLAVMPESDLLGAEFDRDYSSVSSIVKEYGVQEEEISRTIIDGRVFWLFPQAEIVKFSGMDITIHMQIALHINDGKMHIWNIGGLIEEAEAKQLLMSILESTTFPNEKIRCTPPFSGISFIVPDGWKVSEITEEDITNSVVLMCETNDDPFILYYCTDWYARLTAQDPDTMQGIERTVVDEALFTSSYISSLFDVDEDSIYVKTCGEQKYYAFVTNTDTMVILEYTCFKDGYLHEFLYCLSEEPTSGSVADFMQNFMETVVYP